MQKQKATRYKKKKKMEFSKKWLIACVVISLFYTSLSYLYGWFDKNTLETLSVEIIEILWGTSGISFVGYILQNSVRAFTSSKFGLPNETKHDNDNTESG